MNEFDSGGPPVTSIVAADEALVALGELEGIPVEEHVSKFEAIHAALRSALHQPG
jgi:hypothetical protein